MRPSRNAMRARAVLLVCSKISVKLDVKIKEMGSKTKRLSRRPSIKAVARPQLQYNKRYWDIYPTANQRLLMGYFSSEASSGNSAKSYCCEDQGCLTGSEDRGWIRSASRSYSSSRPKIIASQTTTMTRTLVSVKSCPRSVSEVETLPPTGYFATASFVHHQTYVNDDFVSDDEESDAAKLACCKQR